MNTPFSIKKYRIIYNGVAADLFTDRTWPSLDRPLAIFLPGLPDFCGPTALTSALVREGVAVLQPHFAGTYDSDGLFSPEGCRITLRETSHAITDGNLVPVGSKSPLAVAPTVTSLIGHSFGGITALRYFNEFRDLHALIFTSAALHYSHEDPDYGLAEDGMEIYESLHASNPRTYRPAPISEWECILRGLDQLPNRPLGTVHCVRVIYGENDKYFDINVARRNVPELISAYAHTIAGLTIEVVQGAGHYLPELVLAQPIDVLMPEVLGR